MKSVNTFVICALITFSGYAQQSRQEIDPVLTKKMVRAIERIKQLHSTTAIPGVSEFIGPTDAILNGPHQGIMQYYIDPIFPDSTVTTKFGTSAAQHVQTMKAGGMFDPKSTYYTPSQTLPVWEPYTVDTIWIAGSYTVRTSSANAKDTLQLEVSWGYDTSSFYSAITSTSPAQNWTMPKNNTSAAAGNKCFSTSPAANSLKMKHVLTTADTVTVGAAGANWPYIAFVPATPISVPAGGIVGIQYTYINKSAVPSNKVYYVSPNNTATMNSYFGFISADTSGVTHNYFYDSTSLGTSGVVSVMSRYAKFPTAQSFLNGVMLPQTEEGYVWDLSISHSVLVTGSEELKKSGMSLGQNIPNPFNSITEIPYFLNSPTDVQITVYDLTGRMIQDVSLGKMDTGNHTFTLNSSGLCKGVYFYTLRANGMSQSRKMVISK